MMKARTYYFNFAALVALTVITVGLSMLRMHPWHLAVGAAIGALKVCLVALFFMHLIRGPARTWLAAGVGLFWLLILLVLSMTDYFTRTGTSF